MHAYISYLLEDIANAVRKEIPPVEPAKSFEEEMEELERWCEGSNEPEHTFGYYCGLQPENFPPASQLSTEEIIVVTKAFRKMMFTWNIGIDLPKTMPPSVQYAFVVDSLNEKITIVNSGFITIDFCTGYAPDCKLKEYCNCLEIWNKSPEEDIK
jgi:hypothetical protein